MRSWTLKCNGPSCSLIQAEVVYLEPSSRDIVESGYSSLGRGLHSTTFILVVSFAYFKNNRESRRAVSFDNYSPTHRNVEKMSGITDEDVGT